MPTFETPRPISAAVDIILGDICFIAGERADTVVEVHPIDPSRTLDIEAAEHVSIVYANSRLLIRHPKLRTAFTSKYGSVRVLVRLPTGSDVQGATAEGEYLVQGSVGSCRLTNAIGDIRVGQATDVRLKTTGGRVTVDHVAGPADVSGHGDIRIRRVDGDAVVKSIGGDITVDLARASINATTSGGDIRIGELGTGPVELYAAIGKLEVGVPHGTAVRLDARPLTGRVRNYLESDGQSDRTVQVRARCNGGDIVVHPAGAGHDTFHREAQLSRRG